MQFEIPLFPLPVDKDEIANLATLKSIRPQRICTWISQVWCKYVLILGRGAKEGRKLRRRRRRLFSHRPTINLQLIEVGLEFITVTRSAPLSDVRFNQRFHNFLFFALFGNFPCNSHCPRKTRSIQVFVLSIPLF